MVKRQFLTSYRGKLTPDQVAEGMNLAIATAARLLRDARHLFEAQSYATACSLAALSIEESGKIGLLRALAIASDEKALKEAWRKYRDHQAKNAMWVYPDEVKRGARRLSDMMPMFNTDSFHMSVLDGVKQIGFYSDCYVKEGRCDWADPDALIDRDLAAKIISAAALLIPKKLVASREIELFVEHVGPPFSKGSDFIEMREGIIAYHLAKIREGLSTDDPVETEEFYRDFLR